MGEQAQRDLILLIGGILIVLIVSGVYYGGQAPEVNPAVARVASQQYGR